MSEKEQNQALVQIYQEVQTIQPTDLEVMQMFEEFLKTQPQEEINLPHGYGQ